jgi:hypothetical protein
MKRHQDRHGSEQDDRSDQRFYPATDQSGDPEREQSDHGLLDASDLLLQRPELNTQSNRNDAAQREESDIHDGIGNWVLTREPHSDRDDGNAYKHDARQQ